MNEFFNIECEIFSDLINKTTAILFKNGTSQLSQIKIT